mgnify:CR=1 FL=1
MALAMCFNSTGLIRVATIRYEKLAEFKFYVAAKAKGLIYSEGKEYVVQEGNVIEFRFNV